jgi:hypothetical protein
MVARRAGKQNRPTNIAQHREGSLPQKGKLESCTSCGRSQWRINSARLGHKRENFNTSCYRSYYSTATVLKLLVF